MNKELQDAIDALESIRVWCAPHYPRKELIETIRQALESSMDVESLVSGLERRLDRFQDIVGWQEGESRNTLVCEIRDAAVEYTQDHLAAQGRITPVEGYVMVPVEPTEKMERAAFNIVEIDYRDRRFVPYENFHSATGLRNGIYKAMINAAMTGGKDE